MQQDMNKMFTLMDWVAYRRGWYGCSSSTKVIHALAQVVGCCDYEIPKQ